MAEEVNREITNIDTGPTFKLESIDSRMDNISENSEVKDTENSLTKSQVKEVAHLNLDIEVADAPSVASSDDTIEADDTDTVAYPDGPGLVEEDSGCISGNKYNNISDKSAESRNVLNRISSADIDKNGVNRDNTEKEVIQEDKGNPKTVEAPSENQGDSLSLGAEIGYNKAASVSPTEFEVAGPAEVVIDRAEDANEDCEPPEESGVRNNERSSQVNYNVMISDPNLGVGNNGPDDNQPAVIVKEEPIDPDEFEPSVSFAESALRMYGSNIPESLSENMSNKSVATGTPVYHNGTHTEAENMSRFAFKIKMKKGRGRPKKNADSPPLNRSLPKPQKWKPVIKAPLLKNPPDTALMTDLCLVCSAPCIITRNRKIPSLPFCKKCKKAYFYQKSRPAHQKSRYCPASRVGSRCVIHFKSPNHCVVCHHLKFQEILKASQSAFKSKPNSTSVSPNMIRQHMEKETDFDLSYTQASNDPQLIQKALRSRPCVLLDKMPLSQDSTFNAKLGKMPLPQDSTFNVKGLTPEKGREPRMFIMPYEDDVVKQEILPEDPRYENGMWSGLPVNYQSQGDVCEEPTDLSPIRFPPLAHKSPDEKQKGRVGRKRKLDAVVQELTSDLAQTDQDSQLKKLSMGPNDVQVFILQCRHACSVCNDSKAKQWLQSNGYKTVEPTRHTPGDVPLLDPNPFQLSSDSHLYQKFLEFYNAVLKSNTDKPSTSGKSPKIASNKSSPAPSRPSRPPMSAVNPSNATVSSANQSLVMVVPKPPQVLDQVQSAPSSTTPLSGIGPRMGSNISDSVIRQQLAATLQARAQHPSVNMANPTLNSLLFRPSFMARPNHTIFVPHSLPGFNPFHVPSPSSDVRPPGAPYLLSPSSRVIGKNNLPPLQKK